MRRRAALALPLLLPQGLRAQPRQVRVVVPYPAGGWADVTARVIFTRLGQRNGQLYVVENRSGAGGQIGAQAAAQAPADGSVLLYGASALSVAPSLYPRLNFLPVRDLAPVCLTTQGPMLLVANPARPERDVAAVLALARRTPGGLDWASGGIGTTPHLTAVLFALTADIQLNHITYRGGAPALNDVIAGQVGFLFSTAGASVPAMRAGVVRALGHSATQALPGLEGVPPVAATVPGFQAHDWYAVFAPPGTPGLATLNAELNAVLAEPEVARQINPPGSLPAGGTAAALGAMLAAETEKWGAVVRAAGIRAS